MGFFLIGAIVSVAAIATIPSVRKWLNNIWSMKHILLSKDQFKVNDGDASATIEYEHYGEPYVVHIPYNRGKIMDMNTYKAELLLYDKTLVDITQQPGIPYTLSAFDMGGLEIRITNTLTGQTTVYDRFAAPMYATDASFQE